FIPDPVILMEIGGRKLGVFSRLEFGRAEKESALDILVAYDELVAEAKKRFGLKRPGPAELIRLLALDYELTRLTVPQDFPYALAAALIKGGLELEPAKGMLFPQREKKTAAEAEAIRAGNRASAAGIRAAEQALSRSAIKKGNLYLGGKQLTSERLRVIIQTACLEVGAVANQVICAGGDQACDPHSVGSGPLRANELIIVDVFPRVSKSGYHGDMTRTFLKGKASPEQKRLVASVRAAQKAALAKIKASVCAGKVHGAAEKAFKQAGYQSGQIDGVWQGFIHSTGHGLGLEVHEQPRVSTGLNRLKAGAVITVEPGLYYPGLGGCRIEDVVQVTKDGYTLLSKAPYRWELK
ncbi:MAG: M24 family metallopeptidase, partial [Verrucomicrobiota bacterium]